MIHRLISDSETLIIQGGPKEVCVFRTHNTGCSTGYKVSWNRTALAALLFFGGFSRVFLPGIGILPVP